MKGSHWFSTGLGAVLSVAPQLLPFLPPKYADIATAALAMATGVWHLFTPVPPR